MTITVTELNLYASSMGAMLGTLVSETRGLIHAVLASVEGVPVAVSTGLPPVRADQLAGIGAGLLSIADGAGRTMETGVAYQVVVEMSEGIVLATPVAPRVGLTLLATADCDRERLGYEIAQFVQRVAPLLEHLR